MARDKAENTDIESAPKKKSRRMLIFAAIPIILAGLGAGAYFFVPGLLGKTALPQTQASQTAVPQPVFIDLPEMSVTLPNGGQARQLRIRISLELMATASKRPQADILSPKVYDALLIYLRTLTDSEVEGSLAIDRMRGDLYRRLELLLGPNVVHDVLITSLIVA